MKPGYSTALAAGALALALALPAYSQSANTSAPPQTAPAKQDAAKSSMSMDDMMKQCREHCSMATKQMDEMMKKMTDASASNDPAKMRAALDDAQKPLTEMKGQMEQCMSMMDMMQKMGGMMKK